VENPNQRVDCAIQLNFADPSWARALPDRLFAVSICTVIPAVLAIADWVLKIIM